MRAQQIQMILRKSIINVLLFYKDFFLEGEGWGCLHQSSSMSMFEFVHLA